MPANFNNTIPSVIQDLFMTCIKNHLQTYIYLAIPGTAGTLGHWQQNPTVCDIALSYDSASVSWKNQTVTLPF